MTRKDYIVIADSIRETVAQWEAEPNQRVEVNGKEFALNSLRFAIMREFVSVLCRNLKAENGRFDADKFLDRAGL